MAGFLTDAETRQFADDLHEQEALAFATEIAEAGDWSFEGLQGYKNQFPDAGEKVRAIMARYPKAFRTGGKSHEDVARAVAATA